MFAVAAINDTNSKEQLAPTKEAQEFQLSQIYHEGLLKLQAKDYEKARELLESVLRDPLISEAKVESSSSDDNLLQLRFLALKNLANVFLQQGSAHYENALRCYLQAVQIDTKDSVIWNQLGTLSCSMGLLSISRWAFWFKARKVPMWRHSQVWKVSSYLDRSSLGYAKRVQERGTHAPSIRGTPGAGLVYLNLI